MSIGATWAGTHTFTAPELVEARSIPEVQEAVVGADGPVRALGTRHSFNDLADSTGRLVTVTGIPADATVDEEARTVTVGAGTRYGELAVWLESHGWALHNMGSLPHISVGGAVATGTHGSGLTNGCLSDAVAALTYVNAAGELVEARRGDEGFEGLVVGLGAYGIVVRVTLDIQPTYLVRQDVYRGLSWEAALGDLSAIMGAGYSVSLFTLWDEPTIQQAWRKTRIGLGEDPQDGWQGARFETAAEAGLVDVPPANLTVKGGVPGPWLERLPHFRLDSTPSNGDEIQTEYFVALADGAEALAAVKALGHEIAPHLLVSELRTVAADGLWLSGAYGRDTLAIHFTWRNAPEAVAALTPRIEAALAPFGARPHWGKVHTMTADAVAAVTPRLADARAQFETLDPAGRFANAHLRRLGVRL
ncbi:FAD-binding protein [Demequina muriae]|uniref:FAD-binding protein n=1 Tax=Demequina muriae TaxID=3051664 RepID=A0ABT8GHB9_9MICO|nr:FAD-binding protein [Demequina sp. EGI L300058]MDN4480759.1 FAD-binding protein [Demequina sp. EGI L300058]